LERRTRRRLRRQKMKKHRKTAADRGGFFTHSATFFVKPPYIRVKDFKGFGEKGATYA